MGRVQIEELPIYKTLHYGGTYTKDTGNDDEYRPEEFGFTLSVTINEAEDDPEHLEIKWGVLPYDNKEQKEAIELRIINYYYKYILS